MRLPLCAGRVRCRGTAAPNSQRGYNHGMAAKDVIHDAVKNALIKDGWTITHDPLRLQYQDVTLLLDLAAERVLAAERDGVKIAVEIKSFLEPSLINDLKVTVGQYQLYLDYLELLEPDRKLYIAISQAAFKKLMSLKGLGVFLEKHKFPFIVVELEDEEVKQWIN
jgi:hypothetical protein